MCVNVENLFYEIFHCLISFLDHQEDLWLHMRQHIPPEKMLECPRCTFVTDLKHHLEYHLRSSHIGSKPYKCDKCTYRCFNQSMLNSHAKSHTNVYQFRCRDCTFAAKYCHALKVCIQMTDELVCMGLRSSNLAAG